MSTNQTITISGYKIREQIYESANSLVYRGIREQDNQPVILKVLKQDYPTPSELTRYKQEYEITRNLTIDGVVKAYDIQPYQRTLVMILDCQAIFILMVCIKKGVLGQAHILIIV